MDDILKVNYYRKRMNNSSLTLGQRRYARQYVNGWEEALQHYSDCTDVYYMQAEARFLSEQITQYGKEYGPSYIGYRVGAIEAINFVIQNR